MPCNDGGIPYPPSPEEIAFAQFAKRAPSLLCSACRALERLGYDFDENPELSEWWDKHKTEDAKKQLLIQQEQAKKELAQQREQWERGQLKDIMNKPISDLTKVEKTILRKYKIL